MDILNDGKCATVYPLLMVHGMGFRDRKHLNYWGRIPVKLMRNGARVFYGGQDSAGSAEDNAVKLAGSLENVLKATGADKVNIIAHSKGGLEARLLASRGYADRIASISTINTPHNGSVTVDRLMRLPRPLIRLAARLTDLWMKLLGDESPDALSCFELFMTAAAERFNAENPVPEGVLCQSFAFKMKNARGDLTMMIPYLVVRHFEGDNDGLLPERAVRWAQFRGVYTSVSGRGISHPDQVDIRRMRFSRRQPTNDHEIADITDFYIRLVSELKSKGL